MYALLQDVASWYMLGDCCCCCPPTSGCRICRFRRHWRYSHSRVRVYKHEQTQIVNGRRQWSFKKGEASASCSWTVSASAINLTESGTENIQLFWLQGSPMMQLRNRFAISSKMFAKFQTETDCLVRDDTNLYQCKFAWTTRKIRHHRVWERGTSFPSLLTSSRMLMLL